MKKVRFLFLILALVLVVGMTTGLIVRKQTGGQTVMQHSGAPAPVCTTPATTGDDEPAAPEAEVFKIPVLISESISQYFTVIENGVEVDPIDVFEYSRSSGEKSKGGDPEVYYSQTYVRYLVDPICSSIEYDHSLRPSSGWCFSKDVQIDFSDSCCFDFPGGYQAEINNSSGSIDLSYFLFVVIFEE